LILLKIEKLDSKPDSRFAFGPSSLFTLRVSPDGRASAEFP
jgi:hypothetical protein